MNEKPVAKKLVIDEPAVLVRAKRIGDKAIEPAFTARDMKALSRTLRLGLGFSQYEWARLLGVEEKSVARIESERGSVTRQFGNFVRLLSVSRVRDIEVTLDALLAYDDSDYAEHAKKSFVERVKARAVAVQATFDSTLVEVARLVDLDWYAQKYNRVRSSGAYKGGK